MGGKKPLRRPLWPPTRATASNYYPLGLDGAGGAAKPLLRAPKKPAPLHGRLPAFSGAVDAFERARKCFLEWRYFFSIILSEFLKNRVALHPANTTVKAKSSFPLEVGEVVTIKATYSPFSASVDFGLIAPDNLFYGLNTKSGSFDEAIEVTQRGNYVLAVRNNSSQTIHVSRQLLMLNII